MNRVAFILAPGHSGSTLLGDMLGTHSRAIHVGEIISPLEKGKAVRCLHCDEQPCPIWTEAASPRFVERCYRSYRRATVRNPVYRLRAYLQHPMLRGEKPGALYVRLFERMPSIDWIIDSSKNIRWAEWNSKRRTLPCRTIFLFRDVRALVASRMRNRGESIDQATAAVRNSLIPLLSSFRNHPNPFHVRYEQLASDPRATCAELCRYLQLPFEEEMLHYYRHAHHIFGGNVAGSLEARRYRGEPIAEFAQKRRLPPSYTTDAYYRKGYGFKLDQRWTQELNEDIQKQILRTTADINGQMGYANHVH